MDDYKLHGHPKFYELTTEEVALHSAKSKDYAKEATHWETSNGLGVFSAFTRTSTPQTQL